MQLNNMRTYNALNKKFKESFVISSYEIKRDLTAKVFSNFVLYDHKDKIDLYDIFYIKDFFIDKVSISGMIIKKQRINEIQTQVQVVFGADVWTNEIYIPNNSLNGVNLSENNLTQYNITLNTTDSLITSNNFLNWDTMCRQAMRKSSKVENFSDLWNPIIEDTTNDIFNIKADDNRLLDLKSSFARDNFNKLTIYNQDDKSKKIVGYLNNGVYSKTPDPNIIYTPKYEVVMIDNFNEEYLKNRLKSQEYNNKFEFNVVFDTKIEAFKFDNKFLGRRIKILFKDREPINTFISAYSFKDNKKISIQLGLTRTNLTGKLKTEV